ncbi:PREDICTED: short-chain collagen C4-like [Branchiostoma belcheri]|uniref:Short-chain collagen C4-like n=1 Tax=Branchiostoma belcheri TaxID=7741 RepID=A0A6P5A7Z2_BRABE|nr:PREDICTED: short-chain collagen C4-like [Branchiostoma belcheri]
MSTDKLTYSRLVPERGTRGRRERTSGLPGAWVALLLGAGAVVASAAVVAVILQNIGHEMGDLRENIAKLQARADSAEKDLKEAQARAERDLKEVQAQAERDLKEVQAQAERNLKEVQAQAERDLKEVQARAERDQSKLLQEIMSLRERVVVLESFPPSHVEKQTSDTGPVSYPEGDSGDIDTGVQSRNDTLGGLLYRHKREAPNANWVRLPASTCQAGRDGRDGIPGASGLQGPPGQKGDLGQPGTKGARGAGAKGAKGDTGLQGSKGQKGSQGASGNNGEYTISFYGLLLCTGGAVYVRWGRKTCPSGGATIVYSGVAGGTHYGQTGGGTNYQCLPTDPQWGRYENGVSGFSAFMYGAQYRVATNVPFGSTYLNAHDVPCAVCYVPTRGSKLMIPARNTCYSGWTEEYAGYLMASSYVHNATEYVCVDNNPETVPGGQDNQGGAWFYPVEARCGTLPCPNYVEGRELTCVVCTK